MQANVANPLQESTVEAEISALRRETAARRLEMEREFPNGMFDSLLKSAKRRVSEQAIRSRCSLLRATWCLKNMPRDRGQLESEWKTERDFDLVAMFEMYSQAGIDPTRER